MQIYWDLVHNSASYSRKVKQIPTYRSFEQKSVHCGEIGVPITYRVAALFPHKLLITIINFVDLEESILIATCNSIYTAGRFGARRDGNLPTDTRRSPSP